MSECVKFRRQAFFKSVHSKIGQSGRVVSAISKLSKQQAPLWYIARCAVRIAQITENNNKNTNRTVFDRMWRENDSATSNTAVCCVNRLCISMYISKNERDSI